MVDFDDKQIIQHIRDTKQLKEVSKDLYISRLTTIQGKIYQVSLNELINNPEEFSKRVDEYAKNTEGRIYEHLNDHTIDNFYKAVRFIFSYGSLKEEMYEKYKEWEKVHKEQIKSINIKYDSNQPTTRQKEGYIDYDELIKIRNGLTIGSPEKLLILFYTEIAPLRSDYASVRIYKNDVPEDNKYANYIVVTRNSCTLKVREYKTSTTYGDLTVELPKKIVYDLRASLSDHPRDYLFTTQRGLQFSSPNAFNQWANALLKKVLNNPSFTLSTFRHIYISRRDLKMEEKSGIKQGELAHAMGHSISQQKKYSWHTWIENGKIDEVEVAEIPLKSKKELNSINLTLDDKQVSPDKSMEATPEIIVDT